MPNFLFDSILQEIKILQIRSAILGKRLYLCYYM